MSKGWGSGQRRGPRLYLLKEDGRFTQDMSEFGQLQITALKRFIGAVHLGDTGFVFAQLLLQVVDLLS